MILAVASEAQLATFAHALLPPHTVLDPAERDLVPERTKVDVRRLAILKGEIAVGADPLGDAFVRLRSPERRRALGAVYTPAPIVRAIVTWAAEQSGPPIRIVDPGVGSGRFLIAAARIFPKAALVGVEIDPLATLIVRANAAVLGLTTRLTVILNDYRALELPGVKGTTLFVGNPPYVRHHDITPDWKAWYADLARAQGLHASKLAGLHLHFFLKTKDLARAGDFGAFITASEWLDVNYGATLRNMFANGLGGAGLHLIDAAAAPFDETLATGVITTFRVGCRPTHLTVRRVASIDTLGNLTGGTAVSWGRAEATPRWSTLLSPPRFVSAQTIELGELFRVHRGQVTGANGVWIAGADAPKLPACVLLPTITSARELIAAAPELTCLSHLANVIDLPPDLEHFDSDTRLLIDRFLTWAENRDAHESYIARHRKPWWCVRLRAPAPILVTYMGRRPPVFVLNTASARHLNIAHGLYPRQSIPETQLRALVQYLNGSVSTADGRTYAGGLVKFEPRELERLPIRRLDNLDGDGGLANQVDGRTVARECSRCDCRFSA